MKYLIRISRLASKEAIKDLKAKNPIFCSALKQNFTVTNIFYNHVVGYKKSRPDNEIIERLIKSCFKNDESVFILLYEKRNLETGFCGVVLFEIIEKLRHKKRLIRLVF